MTQEEKLNFLLENADAVQDRLNRLDEQLDDIVNLLNHMRDRARRRDTEEQERKIVWPD